MNEDVSRVDAGIGVESAQSEELRSDWTETEIPSTAVVEAVATAKDVNPTALPPLNDYVDPDALNRLLQNASSGRVSFQYDGAEVFVTSDGAIEVVTDSN